MKHVKLFEVYNSQNIDNQEKERKKRNNQQDIPSDTSKRWSERQLKNNSVLIYDPIYSAPYYLEKTPIYTGNLSMEELGIQSSTSFTIIKHRLNHHEKITDLNNFGRYDMNISFKCSNGLNDKLDVGLHIDNFIIDFDISGDKSIIIKPRNGYVNDVSLILPNKFKENPNNLNQKNIEQFITMSIQNQIKKYFEYFNNKDVRGINKPLNIKYQFPMRGIIFSNIKIIYN